MSSDDRMRSIVWSMVLSIVLAAVVFIIASMTDLMRPLAARLVRRWKTPDAGVARCGYVAPWQRQAVCEHVRASLPA